MAEESVQRHLAAILAADVVGYSRLMEADEAGTLGRLKALRRDLFAPETARFGGRIFKLTGDGALAEFSSATNAVQSAVAIQRALAKHNADLPEDQRIELRIGISLGDVIVEGSDLYGNGVNVAARLEALADPGGICISSNVHEHVRTTAGLAFADLGVQQVKNIAHPVRAWRVALDASGDKERTDNAAPSLPDKPSIAVLAFDNMSGDPEQENFGDGLAEDIITTLSHISSLFVIARNSSFVYKGQAVDVRKVAAELGVRYVLEGSVRAAGQRLRVTAQLIDAVDGNHLWAERFDRRMDDIFDIQDEIMREIVTALRIKLSDGEQARIWLRGTDSVEAWTSALQGIDLMEQGSATAVAEGRRLFEHAIAIDPDYAMAHASIAWTHYIDGHFGYTEKPDVSFQLAIKAAQRASALDPESAQCEMIIGAAEVQMGLDPNAIDKCRLAHRKAPNDTHLKVALARILTNVGELAEAEELLRESMRLDPCFHIHYYGILANVLERQGRDEEAIALLQRALAQNRNYFSGHLRLASLLGIAGQFEEARRHAAEARRLNPKFGRHSLAGYYPTNDPTALQRFVSGLEAAGFDLS